MARFLARQGYSGRTAPEVLVERIAAHAGTPNPGVDAARTRAMLPLVDLLEQVTRILDDYETAISGVLERHPDARLFASFPGTGLVTTATLLAEIGEDRPRFPSPGSLLAEAGLAPVTRQSGSSRWVGAEDPRCTPTLWEDRVTCRAPACCAVMYERRVPIVCDLSDFASDRMPGRSSLVVDAAWGVS